MKTILPGMINWRTLVASLAMTFIVACATEPPQPTQIPEDPRLDTYVIGIPDLLSVTVWGQPDLSSEALVRRDGKISVALVGDSEAAGRTPEQLSREIEKGLSRFVAEPRVDVAVVEMRSQVVSVIGGGVQQSGVLELRSDMRVIDAIAEMGGLTPFAKGNQIRVLRGEQSYSFNYDAFMSGGEAKANFLLAPGDTIVVPD